MINSIFMCKFNDGRWYVCISDDRWPDQKVWAHLTGNKVELRDVVAAALVAP